MFQNSVKNLTPKMIFFKRRALYHFKTREFKNLQAFEFSLIIDEIVLIKANLEFLNFKINKRHYQLKFLNISNYIKYQ